MPVNELMGILPSAIILGILVAIALFIALSRGWADNNDDQMRRAVQIAAITVILQAVHFTEELLTGLEERLPSLFGLDAMSLAVFVLFNVAWLVIWSVSVWGLRTKHRAALFPLWFLALGCVFNGIAHPLLSAMVGGYFPGLATSPVVGLAGILLLRSLLQITQTVNSRLRAA